MYRRIWLTDALTPARSTHVAIAACGHPSFTTHAELHSAPIRDFHATRLDLAVAH
jgi:hypothetical protein